MNLFKEYLEKVTDPQKHERIVAILNWILTEFPDLEPKVAWN